MKPFPLILQGTAALAIVVLTVGCNPASTNVDTSTGSGTTQSTDSNMTGMAETPSSNVTGGSETPVNETPVE